MRFHRYIPPPPFPSFGDDSLFVHEQTDYRFPYVEGHRYEFRVAPTQGFVRVTAHGCENSRQRETVCCENSRQPESVPRDETEAMNTGLQVSFSVVSAYKAGERLHSADATRLCPPPAFKASSFRRSKSPTPQVTGRASASSSRPVDSPRSPSARVQPSTCDSGPGKDRPLSPTLASVLLVADQTEVIANGSHRLSKPTQTLDQKASPRAMEGRLPHGHNAEAGIVGYTGEGGIPSRSTGPEMYDGGGRGSVSPLRTGYHFRTGNDGGYYPVATQFPTILRSGAGDTSWAGSDGTARRYDSSGNFSRVAYVDNNSHSLRNVQNLGPSPYAMGTDPSARGNEGWTKERQTVQLQWNPAWEGNVLSPRTAAPDSQSLPLIQRHTDVFPRSRFGEQGEHWSSQDRGRGAHLRPSYGHTHIPLDRRRLRIRDESSFYRCAGEDQPFLQAEVRAPKQISAAPHGRGLGRGEVINAGPRGFAAGGHRVMDRHSRPWEHVSGENGHLPNRPPGLLGWANETNTRPIAGDSSPRWRRKVEKDSRRDVSTDPRDGFAATVPAGGDERQRGREIDENTYKSYPSSGRDPGSTLPAGSLGSSPSELRWKPGAPSAPRPAPRDSKGRRVVIGGESFAPQHGYRHNNSTVNGDGTNARIREESIRERRGEEQPRFDLSIMVEPVRDSCFRQRWHQGVWSLVRELPNAFANLEPVLAAAIFCNFQTVQTP